MFGVGYRLKVHARGVRRVAIGTAEPLSGAIYGFAQVERMIEDQGIRVFQLLLMDLEVRMVFGEGIKDGGVAVHGSGSMKYGCAVSGSEVERRERELLALAARSFHRRTAAVTRVALSVGRRQHATMTLMLAVTGRTRMITGDIRLVKLVSGVASQAVVINFRHHAGGDLVKPVRLQRAGSGVESGAQPFGDISSFGGDVYLRGRMTRAAAFATGPSVLELRKDNTVVLRRHWTSRDESPLPRATKANEQHDQRDGGHGHA